MNPTATPSGATMRKNEALLLDLADAVNTTLDLDALLSRIAELVRSVLDYEIFAIMLLNEKTQELWMRFQIGHSTEVSEGLRVKVGRGITGQAVARGEAMLVNDVSEVDFYINAHPGVRAELAVPLILKNRVIGVIDIQASQAGYFTEEHRRLLTMVASRIATGIENARLYTRVARQAKTLGVLNEISRELTSILNLDQLLQRIGDLLSRLIDFHMFSILLPDASGTRLQHRFSMRFNEKVQVKLEVPLGEGLVGYAAQHREAVLVPDVRRDRRYLELNPETRSELAVPLIYKDRLIGVLDLEHTKRGYFTERHVRTMSTLAAQLAIAIENARLYERVQREEKRLERDLATARELQFRLLPPCCPMLVNAQLAARYAPAHAIGGDLYDFLDYSLERTAIVIGDVSGKGAAAALYAALVSGLLRSTAAAEPRAAEMLSVVNQSLKERTIDAQFVSLIFAIWDDRERTLQLANSGLPRPIHWRQGRDEVVEATGLPLGLFDDATYDEFNLRAEPGDLFVFFSDGILDATNRDGEPFGRDRVHQEVARHAHLSADEVVAGVFDAVARFSAGVAAFDDQTVVALKVSR